MQASPPLAGLRVLLVEDHYFVAAELAQTLRGQGAVVLGPVGTVRQANDLGTQPHDLALLNVDLHGEPIFPLAEALLDRGVPVALVTGYDRAGLPGRFRTVPRLEKPVDPAMLIATVLRLAGRSAPMVA